MSLWSQRASSDSLKLTAAPKVILATIFIHLAITVAIVSVVLRLNRLGDVSLLHELQIGASAIVAVADLALFLISWHRTVSGYRFHFTP